MVTDYSKDFNFITDRLAIGCLASRSTHGGEGTQEQSRTN